MTTTTTSREAEPGATAAPTALPEGVEFLWMNPADLIVDANIRTHLDITPDFRKSIREDGVRVPVSAIRAPEGIKVREGQQRTITATEEQVPWIPVYVIPDRGDVERILGQLAENHQRAAMTQQDTAGAFEQLALLGMSAGQIAKRAHRTKAEVVAGLTVAKSTAAAEAAGQYALDLTDAALFAEFDGDEEAAATLADVAERGGSLAHAAQRIRDERARTQAVAAVREALTAEGVRVTYRPAYYDSPVREVAALRVKGQSEPMTVEQHATCPHHAAWVAYNEDTATASPVYVCTNPKAAGHLRWSDPAQKVDRTPLSEAERAERRQVRENNAAWRSAETVRREWLPTLARRKTPPKGGAEFVAYAVVHCPGLLSEAALRGHALAARLLGFKKDFGGGRYLADLLDKATTPRSQVIALTVALAAVEESTGTHTWRNALPGGIPARYLLALESWGYGLSDIEQAVTGRTPDPEDTAAAAA
ncbi:MAG: hypothetical protein IE923_07965 [Micrococcales bacterium]|nr:hypothetical protein [Micrococcales bacterium]